MLKPRQSINIKADSSLLCGAKKKKNKKQKSAKTINLQNELMHEQACSFAASMNCLYEKQFSLNPFTANLSPETLKPVYSH